MTDYKIACGDNVVDSAGKAVRLDETDAKFQRAFICASARLSGFVYDRTIGSRCAEIGLLQEGNLGRLQLAVNEAFARFENTNAKIEDYNEESITLTVTIDGESRTEEVRFYGNV